MATVNYIPCKKQCPASLTGLSNYVRREDKTNRYLISGQNCSPQFSQLVFLATRDQFRKTSPQYFYHYTQSFHPNEPVTGELAHTIAKKFAAKAWPNSEVLIATHIDADHIHSHFVVNAVRTDGRMLHALYEISDRAELLTSTLHTKSLPSSSQMTELIQQMKLLNEALKKPEPVQPVGERKEKRFSLPVFHLSLPEWPTVFTLVMTLAVSILLLLWFKSGGDWSSFSLLNP